MLGASVHYGEPREVSRVWIVEDSPLEAEMARRALGPDHHDLRLFSDGSAVIERIAAETTPDAIVLDWQMPGMSGLETCLYLRAQLDSMALPILMLTVQGRKEDIVEGLNAGANDYLTKPYDISELRARVQSLVRTARLHRIQAWRGKLLALDAELGSATTRSTDRDELARSSASIVQRHLGLDSVSIWLVDETGALQRVGASEGHDDDQAAAAAAVASNAASPAPAPPTTAPLHVELLLLYEVAIGALVARASVGISRDVAHGLHGVTDLLALSLDRMRAEAERQRLLDRERAARADAEAANQTKDEFLAMVSHELRTPLNAIAGWTRILLRAPEALDERTRRGLDTIDRNVHAQTQLINDLLDVSRIVAGKMRLEVGQVEIAQVVESALDAVRLAADAKRVVLRTAMDPLIFPVAGDADRLQQIVWNLLTNAIKFSSGGSEVAISVRQEEGALSIVVSDAGQGIPADFLPLVFERFRQAENSISRSGGGLGLGLAITRSLVELHGGTVTVASEGPGRGATFTVRLPTARPSVREIGSLASPLRGAYVHPPELIGLRVLVVEDQPDARAMLVELLEECRAVVYAADSAAEGMRLLQDHRPDILLSDIGMPGEDGYSFVRRVRELGAEAGGALPAIALTANERARSRRASPPTSPSRSSRPSSCWSSAT
jgi:signal transduction histidine kinase